MKPRFARLAFAFALSLGSLVLAPASALAVCAGGAPNGKCEPPDDDCACDDCLAACSGECTASNPPACTLEDACTCNECWTDDYCTDPEKKSCKDDGDCDFFTEGCCCADCSALSNCSAFSGSCELGTGGTGGSGGSGGSGAAAGSGGSTATGGSGGDPKNTDGGCGCASAGLAASDHAGLSLAALALGALVRKRRRSPRPA